jgi:type IX secretion system PorP/SprF family membrane protein
MTDKVGPARQTGAFLDLAYRIRTGADTRLSFGLKGGVNSFQADLAGLATVNPDQANVNVQGQLMPNFGFGLYWHAPRYYVGLSAPKLLENELVPASTGVITTSSEVRHFFLMGGYVLDLSGRDLKFKPSFMTRAGGRRSPLSVDLNASFLLRERIWFGATVPAGQCLWGHSVNTR